VTGAGPDKRRAGAASLATGELDGAAIERLLAASERDGDLAAEIDLAERAPAAFATDRSSASTPAPRSARGARRWLAPLIAAAGLLAWLSWPRAGSADLADRGPPPYAAVALRDGGTDLAQAFAAAMEPYAAGDHAAAVEALTRFLEGHPGHAPARFYRAAAHEQLGRLEAAAEELAAVASGADGLLADHARWRLANVRLLGDEPDRARAVLREMLRRGGPFSEPAAALLRRLGEDPQATR